MNLKLVTMEPVPKFAADHPLIAETMEQARLTFYCMNCYRKRPTGWVTPNFGPLCEECLEELNEGVKAER